MRRVYLAGPIFGRTDDECTGWRSKMRALLADFEIVDPMDRDYRGIEDTCPDTIVADDKDAIRRCDAVVANMQTASVGTSMEVFFAHLLGMPVVAICFGAARVSPWIRAHAAVVFNEEQAATWLRAVT